MAHILVTDWKKLVVLQILNHSSILPILGRTKKIYKMVQGKCSAFPRLTSVTLTHCSFFHNITCLKPVVFDLLQNDIGSSLLIVQVVVLYCMTTSIKESCDVNDPVAVIQQGIGILIFFYRVS